MDGDRFLAARKLPQTAANFFVGTNSRVPRMSLAQSSHTIPMPSQKSPGLKPSSKVFLKRTQKSPFNNSPTSAKSLSSPRSLTNEGGKVAKAIQLFSTITDEEGTTSAELAELRRGQLLQQETTTSMLSAHVDTSASKTNGADHIEGVSLAPQQQAKKPASPLPVRAEHATPASLPRFPPSSDPELKKGGSLILDAALRQPDVSPSIAKSTQGQVLLPPPALNTYPRSDSQAEMPSPASHLPASSQTSFKGESTMATSSTVLPSPTFDSENSASLLSSPYKLASSSESRNKHELPDLFSWGANYIDQVFAEEMQEPGADIIDSLPEAADASYVLPVPTTDRVGKTLSRSPLEAETLQTSFDIAPFDSSAPVPASAPKSAFSDASAAPSVPPDTPLSEETTASAILPLARSSEERRRMLEPSEHSARPHSAKQVLTTASAMEDSREGSSPCSRSLKYGTSPKYSAPVASADSESTTVLACGFPELGDKLTSRVLAEAVLSDSVQLHCNEPDFEAACLREADQKRHLKMQAPEDDVTDASWVGELLDQVVSDGPISEVARDRHSIHEISNPVQLFEVPKAVLKTPENKEAPSVAEQLQNSLPQDVEEEQHGGMLYPSSLTGEEILSELIDQAQMSTPDMKRDKLRDSLFERTASWIKNTMEENDASDVELAAHQDDEVDLLFVAGTAFSETAEMSFRAEVLAPSADAESLLPVGPDRALSSPRGQGHNAATRRSFQHTQTLSSYAQEAGVDVGRLRGGGHRSHVSIDKDIEPIQEGKIGKTRGQKIGRTFSERTLPGGNANKQPKKTPGRLKIPQREPDVALQKRRKSLELLSARKISSSNRQTGAEHRRSEQSPQATGIARSSNFDDVLRSWSHPSDPEANVRTPPGTAKRRVGLLAMGWDEEFLDSEDEEVASVATCKRLTLKRTSGFTVHSTPRHNRRPSPGKLPRRASEATPMDEPQTMDRVLRKIQPIQGLTAMQQIVSPTNVQAKKAQSSNSLGNQNPYLLTRNAFHLALQESSIHDARQTTPSASRDKARQTTQAMAFTDAPEAREVLRSRDLEDEFFQQQDSPERSIPPPKALRIQTDTREPGRVHGMQSTFSTPKGPDVSVTNTSPHTIPSELWTLDTSNPAISALTDETCVSKSTESKSHSATRKCAVGRSDRHRNADNLTKQMSLEISTQLPSHEQAWPGTRARGELSEHPTQASDFARRHVRPTRLHLGTPRPLQSSSEIRYDEQDRQEHPHVFLNTTSPRQTHESVSSLNGFEISFQLQKPKMASRNQDDTLLEFGLRVLIKPTGENPTVDSCRVRTPSRLEVDARLRKASQIDQAQYEYSNLPAKEMSKVQEEAQAYLLHTLTSPQQRYRGQAYEKLRRSPPYPLGVTSRERGLSSPFSRADTSGAYSPTRSKRPYKEMILTPASVSHSSVKSSILSPRVDLAGHSSPVRRRLTATVLASPIPYIKRAPPRTTSSSYSCYR